MDDFAKGFFQGVSWDGWVKAIEGVMEAASEVDLLE